MIAAAGLVHAKGVGDRFHARLYAPSSRNAFWLSRHRSFADWQRPSGAGHQLAA
jgi:hypothetical protein